MDSTVAHSMARGTVDGWMDWHRACRLLEGGVVELLRSPL